MVRSKHTAFTLVEFARRDRDYCVVDLDPAS
ncbi:MAG: hypothetical protein KatS3mg104_1573 [Phycisphaerae bacterium]|nr:MAG: hypothetical protein KatS3mg104_1573 [Phycisphaerae bacterium]